MAGCADIKVGYDCNNNCKHCVIAEQRRGALRKRGNENRTTEECMKEILNSKLNGKDVIVITGGEPTIRKDIIDIVKYAKSLGLVICMQTNGRKLRDEKFAEEVAKYVDYFTIALHGEQASTHDVITCVRGSFDETLEGMKTLVKFTNNVFIKVVISNYNYKELKGILNIAKTIGVKETNIAFPHANGNAAQYFNEVVPYYKDIKFYVEECIKFAEENNILVEFESILPCIFQEQHNVKYFADFKYRSQNAELKQLDSDTLNWDEVRKNLKRKSEICEECIYTPICEGYWMEYVEERGFDEFNPIKILETVNK